jgi:hypothetical protein
MPSITDDHVIYDHSEHEVMRTIHAQSVRRWQVAGAIAYRIIFENPEEAELIELKHEFNGLVGQQLARELRDCLDSGAFGPPAQAVAHFNRQYPD